MALGEQDLEISHKEEVVLASEPDQAEGAESDIEEILEDEEGNLYI